MLNVKKRYLLFLSVSWVTISSAASLEGTKWLWSGFVNYSHIQIVFENGTVLAMFSCLTARGNYNEAGTGKLQIQINERDTLCNKDVRYLIDIPNYQKFLSSLNTVTSFSITAEGILNLIKGNNDTLQFKEWDETLSCPDELSGEWFSVTTISYFYFFTNGDYELFDACNTNWGRYGIVNDSIFINHGMGTTGACPDKLIEYPLSGKFTLLNDTLAITDSSHTYYYTRLKTTNRYKPIPKANYHQNAVLSGSNVLFDLNGRVLRSKKANCDNKIRAGIYFIRRGDGGRASVHIFSGTTGYSPVDQ